jgi:uncharacterized repeat protein (TIGR03803 family)
MKFNYSGETSANIACGRAARNGIVLAVLFAAIFTAGHAQAAKLTVLHSFCAKANCPDGANPFGELLIDSARTLYGTTASGGAHNGGVFYRLRSDGGAWTYEPLFSFCGKSGCADGNAPLGRLISDVNGNLYGVTRAGGSGGTAFELMQTGGAWKLKTLHRFCRKPDCKDGSQPISGLTYQGAATGVPYDGVSPLYGETEFGGPAGEGVVYALQPVDGKSQWSERVLHGFCTETVECDTSDGSLPAGGLSLDEAGNVFGASAGGGENFSGTIFELSPRDARRWKEKILYDFCLSGCSDGQSPTGIVRDGAGNSYGTTVGQGVNGKGGTLFKLRADGAFTVLHAFCSAPDCTDGHQPGAPPVLDTLGNLYGTTAIGGGNHRNDEFHLGGGVVYRFSAAGDFTVLHAFCAERKCADGETPFTGVTVDPDGHIFGTTTEGGKFGAGVVYEVSP